MELVSAYLATLSRLLAWVVVTALVYRRLGVAAFATLTLVRTTIALLNYSSLGLAPAMIRLISVEDRSHNSGPSVVFSSAMALMGVVFCIGSALACAYGLAFFRIHAVSPELLSQHLQGFGLAMAMGAVLRLDSDTAGAVLQVRGHIAMDNVLVAIAEWMWAALCTLAILQGLAGLLAIGVAWAISGVALCLARLAIAWKLIGSGGFSRSAISASMVRQLLWFGIFVAAAQAADFLYAPTDNLLINRLIDPTAVAIYAPAIQVDAGLLMLVSGLAAILLPRAAIAHSAGNAKTLRRYYLLGTALSLVLLAASALLVYSYSPWLFHLWLHDPMPATVAVLPLVLIHTAIGGSSAVGRSMLLGMGRVRPFTLAALISGIGNVFLSICFVKYAHLGLRGIIYGTIAAVIARCVIWMPWYVLRSIGALESKFS